MVIWIINPFDDIPGEGVRPGRYWSLAEVLSQRGHRVVWYSSNFSHRFKRARNTVANNMNFSIHLVPTTPYTNNIGLKRIYNHYQYAKRFYADASRGLRSHNLVPADKIVVSMPPLNTPHQAFALRREFGGKVIVDIQDAWPETFYRLLPGNGIVHTRMATILFSPLTYLARHAYARTDGISGVAQTYIDLAKAKEQNKPFHVTPIGVLLQEMRQHIGSQQHATKPFTFVYVGSMSANYDLTTVIRAAKQLVSRGYDFQVVMAGTGPDEHKLKRMVEDFKLSRVVQFRGFLDFSRMSRLLGDAAVALNPILPESYSALPNKVGDYLAAGLPVINSIAGELDSLLQKYNAGSYYRAREVSSLAAAMQTYLSDSIKCKIQGENAETLGREWFDRAHTYPAFAKFIEDL